MANKDIPLHDAAECFFDSAQWSEYLSLYPNREVALAELGQPEPEIIGFNRQELEKQPWLHTPQTKRYQRMAKLRDDLVARFREQLVSGELVATGFSSVAIERVTIPAERWKDLWPDFIKDKAKGGTLEFTAVRVSEATASPMPASDLLDRCVEWMKQRGREGQSRRKVLQAEATTVFGPDLTTRMFDTAYKRVFSKRRGRPRIDPPKSQ